MKYFLFRLTPPRRTFMNDMTDKERRLMQEYAVYWRDLMQKGWVVLLVRSPIRRALTVSPSPGLKTVRMPMHCVSMIR